MTDDHARKAAADAIEFSELDLHFARLMARLAHDDDPALALAAALASRATANGDVCVRLADFADRALPMPPLDRESGAYMSEEARQISPLPPEEGSGVGERSPGDVSAISERGTGESSVREGAHERAISASQEKPSSRRTSARQAAMRERQRALPLFDDANDFLHPNPSPQGRGADCPLDPHSVQSGISEAAPGISPLSPEEGSGVSKTAPPLDRWLARLRQTSVVGRPGEFRPLILDEQGRLYLYRYWDYEKRLADSLLALAGDAPGVNEARLRVGLDRFFPDPRDGAQKLAAAMAVLRRLCVISGGPGTGKTTTVVKILALLAEQAGGRRLAVALAAPTGKAAARVQDAIRTALERLGLDPEMHAAIPNHASTLHRLLGARPDSVYYRHHRDNPLALDVLVVDEASMADLALAAKLLEALPRGARLILLGDKDQLASVEAGAVLGDICARAGVSRAFAARLAKVTALPAGRMPPIDAPAAALADSIALLERSYRFGPDSGIGTLARLVNRGEGAGALALLRSGTHEDAAWRDMAPAALRSALAAHAVERFREYFEAVREGSPPTALFARFNAFRVLCAHRTGRTGVVAVNRTIEEALEQERLVDTRHDWYAGRPVMITRNDYNLRLFNGDVGIVLADPDADGELKVCFPGVESAGPDSGRALRRIAPGRLPEHETVYAMTIHKSQGSEFGEVLMILPSEPSSIMTRELVYTGVTRAMQRVEIWGTGAAFAQAVERRLLRASALEERLRRSAEQALAAV